MKKIEHFSHKHPLILNENRSGDSCKGCREPIFGSSYSCKKCSYDLHKSCAELPCELQHPLHRKHPLILLQRPPYELLQFDCHACEVRFDQTFVYHCSLCKFDLDIKCAWPPPTMEVESHKHPLTLMRKWLSFTCDACGKEDTGMPYLCGICGIWFHSKCAALPRTVKHIHHKHPLKLTYSLQNDQLDHRFCQICVERVDLDYWVYHCSSCDFVAHLNCATNEEIWDECGLQNCNLSNEDFGQESEEKGPIDESTSQLKCEDAKLDESVDSILYIVKKTNLEGDETQAAIEIKHFSHEHNLTLIDNLDNNQKCDGCERPIFPPFYRCAQCNFFLHKLCAILPRKKRHPLHQHPLILFPMKIFSSCDACESKYVGFAYCCDKCNFNIDVECSLISDKLTHEGHEHPLFLSYTTSNLNCSACGDSTENMLRCAKCEFTLNFSCATLPRMIWYKQHQHPFALKFTAEDGSGEYYCDICEEPRDPKHWFYYCEKCSYPAHPKCILGDDP